MLIPQGVEIFVAVEPVDMRLGFERLGGLVRERMRREPRSKSALFVFFGKHRRTVKILAWDGTGTVLWYKRLDVGKFEIPRPEREGDASVVVSEAAFEAIFAGLSTRVVH
ncbi:MAG: IS66 family insertion sequence element accessory protein TnpB [Minicystis sp.]